MRSRTGATATTPVQSATCVPRPMRAVVKRRQAVVPRRFSTRDPRSRRGRLTSRNGTRSFRSVKAVSEIVGECVLRSGTRAMARGLHAAACKFMFVTSLPRFVRGAVDGSRRESRGTAENGLRYAFALAATPRNGNCDATGGENSQSADIGGRGRGADGADRSHRLPRT